MLAPWFERRNKPSAGAAEPLPPSLAAGRVAARLRPLFSAERPDLQLFEALAWPTAAGTATPGRYRIIAARAGWLPWLDRMLVRRCVAHLRAGAPRQLRLLCRIDPDSLSDGAFVAELEAFAAEDPALAGQLAVSLGRTRLAASARAALAGLRDRGIAVALRRLAWHPATPAELRRLGFDMVQLELDPGARVPSSARFHAAGLLLVVGHAEAGPVLELGDPQATAA
jgi:EAL domain-containing protein (putative c-di-GMP-specific phosphodiesterase class I)